MSASTEAQTKQRTMPRIMQSVCFMAPRPMRELAILACVVFSIAGFGFLNTRFLSKESALAILQGVSTDGLMVIGMTAVIVSGAFDLSIGSTMAASGLTTGALLVTGCPVGVAIVGGLCTGLLIGLLNGLLVTKLRINALIATLGTMSIVRGVVLVATQNHYPTGFSSTFNAIAWGRILGIPIPVVLLAGCIATADLLFRYARPLRRLYFSGSNEEAAMLTGIRVNRVRLAAFAWMGMLAALAGIIVTARGNAVDPNEGIGAELRVIAAVIVGGASLSGGRGTVLGSFLGLLLMEIITTGLVFAKVAPEAQQIAVGLVLITAATVDRAGAPVFRNILLFLTKTRNRKMERALNVILAVLVIALVFMQLQEKTPGLVAGNPQTRDQRYVMVAAATWGPYWIDSKAGLHDKGRELGVDTIFTGPPTVDVNGQVESIQRAIADGVDGLIVAPMSDALTPAINQAVDKGIPVVCADADAPSSKRLAFIGTGNFEAGRQGGEMLAEALGGSGQVALMTIPGVDNLARRVDGYRAAFAEYPAIEVVAVGNDQGSVAQAQKAARAILQAHAGLDGFGCVGAAGGQGAAVAVKEAGLEGKVQIVSMDRDEATLQFIEEGVIHGSIAQRTYTMTYVALQLLYDLHNDRIQWLENADKVGVDPLPPFVDTGSFAITKDNVRYFFRNDTRNVEPSSG